MNVIVVNTTIQNCANSGVFVKANGAFFARLSMTQVRLTRNGAGLTVEDNALVYVRDSIAADSIDTGFIANSTFGGAAQLTIENSSSSNNGNAGIVSQNPGAAVRILNTTIDHNNGAGLVPLAGGQLLSAGNNHTMANAAGDGTITGTIPPM
jgi:hypothetical protein